KPADYPNAQARTAACEITANEFVPEPLPPTPITLKDFPGFPAHESTDQRYRRLCQLRAAKWPDISTVDDHSNWPESGDLEQAQWAIAELVKDAGLATGADMVPEELRDTIMMAIGSGPGTDWQTIFGTGKAINDWRQQLRYYGGQALEVQPTYSRPPR